VKRNGIFQARLVACGYSQVPEIHFIESFMTSSVVDIETAFLHGDLDEENYMEVPKGLAIQENNKLILQKTIYGLVQSVRKFYENLFNVLNVIEFHGRKSDPCLWTMWDEKVYHMIIIGLHVNDCLVIGK
jgi:hypothetical protein